MSAFPQPCGRTDRHDEHEWTRPRDPFTDARTFRCSGRVMNDAGFWADWDALDDAAEDEMERDRIDQKIEDALREGWGRSA